MHAVWSTDCSGPHITFYKQAFLLLTFTTCDTVVCFAGAIELSVFSEHYKVELDVVDVQSQRIDRFGTQTISSVLVVTMYKANGVVCMSCFEIRHQHSAVNHILLGKGSPMQDTFSPAYC